MQDCEPSPEEKKEAESIIRMARASGIEMTLENAVEGIRQAKKAKDEEQSKHKKGK